MSLSKKMGSNRGARFGPREPRKNRANGARFSGNGTREPRTAHGSRRTAREPRNGAAAVPNICSVGANFIRLRMRLFEHGY